MHPCDSAGTLGPLLHHGRQERVKRGQELWRLGEPAAQLVIPCTGFYKLSVPREERSDIVAIVARGSVLGEEAAHSGGVRSTGCTALAQGKILLIDASHVEHALRAHPEILLPLLQAAIRRTSRISAHLADLGRGSVRQRLGKALLDLCDEHGLPDARGVFVPIRLTRGDFADLAGCRAETAIRCLSAWEREGIVETSREGVVLFDRDRLSAAMVE